MLPDQQPNWQPYGALYIHVPFCRSRCNYCDFHTQAVAPDDPRLDAYVEHLVADLRRAAKQGSLAQVRTIYLGGGTPSYLGNRRLTSLLYALSLSLDLGQVEEFTLEANPESLTVAMVKDVFSLGVNRFSLGVQSFDDRLLRILGRVHDAAAARAAIQAIQTRTNNISLDLICGIPTQTPQDWERDLTQAAALEIAHISVYPLEIHPDTPFGRRYAASPSAGLPDEDVVADMLEQAATYLPTRGFAHYEIASYARPGCQSRHNSAYWTGVPYLGLGEGAWTMRQDEHRRERWLDGQLQESIDADARHREDIMLGLRLANGVEYPAAPAAPATPPIPDGTGTTDNQAVPPAHTDDVLKNLLELRDLGLLEQEGNHWWLSHRGLFMANEVFERFL
jgi:oxygen-independent coproporphyrinogen-3 oxidase